MKKTAKQMFEKLGWECEEFQEGDFHQIKYIKEEKTGEVIEITFDLINKYIEFFSYDKILEYEIFATYVSPQLFQAINKQVEELGWGKEEENEN